MRGQSTDTPTYTLLELHAALQNLGVLDTLLHNLQSQIVRELVTPIVTLQTLSADDYKAEDDVLQFKEDNDLSLTGVISGLRFIVQFVQRNICPRSTTDMPEFLSSFSETIYQQALETLIIPSVPENLNAFPLWLDQVEQCARWEEEGPVGVGGGILRRFLDSQVAVKWLASHRAVGLLETRKLVFEGWRGWDGRLEEVNVGVGHPPKADIESTEEGWGFDGDLPENEANSASAKIFNDEGDGWDFDDIAPAPPAASPPSTRLAKPAREAKRLGKRITSKQPPAVASHEALSETSNDDQPSFQPSIDNARRPLQTDSTSPKPEGKVSNSILVSVAVDAALELLSRRLLEFRQLEDLR